MVEDLYLNKKQVWNFFMAIFPLWDKQGKFVFGRKVVKKYDWWNQFIIVLVVAYC